MLALSLAAPLIASLGLNALLLFRLKKKTPKTQSYEVQELMMDLLAGDALVRVTRVAPENVLLRSPRTQ